MTPTLSPRVRRITLDGAGVTLSALLSEADPAYPAEDRDAAGTPGTQPRATVVALHGGGMSAGYFDGQAHPDLSLLTLGARLGWTVLAVDRPGYGASAAALPDGQTLAVQAAHLRAALRDFASRFRTGAGLFLLAHSYGGKLALTCAADPDGLALLGLDISGCGHLYATDISDVTERGGEWRRNWGVLGLYPPNAFRLSESLVSPMPDRERREAARWPEIFPGLAARIRVPVRLTFAGHEYWWRHDSEAIADLTARLSAAPRVEVDRQPDAGHNISLGWAARAYHLRALAFAEECRAGLDINVRSVPTSC
ncbi:alpha/beta hydrolase [Micromonospora zamorensis]|uniref:alpha/beta hydrolase n=1 Tax=Micromonospora zamorensis TaxID=709883 RepID=UPI003D8F4B41